MSDYYLVIKNLQTMRDLSTAVGKALLEREAAISCAESCTGGLLSSLLTDVEGSSAYMQGTVVAYANEVKEKLLGVKHETLEKYGAVSEETAREMARGAARRKNLWDGFTLPWQVPRVSRCGRMISAVTGTK